ncbi:hypothetical protein KDA_44400 [Dictyobacter alpinus]|uniref:Uncharacterized protein n=1 Tax=Dictyobacter alpinus TaxID=2014873 RepID=A0A402BCA5_9CHLR|nr:hypothetical protein KDA_44400 [Dictyobacter alpinus]
MLREMYWDLSLQPARRMSRHKSEVEHASLCSPPHNHVFEGHFLRELGQAQDLRDAEERPNRLAALVYYIYILAFYYYP